MFLAASGRLVPPRATSFEPPANTSLAAGAERLGLQHQGHRRAEDWTRIESPTPMPATIPFRQTRASCTPRHREVVMLKQRQGNHDGRSSTGRSLTHITSRKTRHGLDSKTTPEGKLNLDLAPGGKGPWACTPWSTIDVLMYSLGNLAGCQAHVYLQQRLA